MTNKLRCIAIISFIALAICSPFLISIMKNEIKLVSFSNQLDAIDRILGKPAEVIAEGSQIYVGGNDEACTYRATRVYRYFTKNTNGLEKKIRDIKFQHVNNSNMKTDVDSYVLITPLRVIITIEDGPYSAGFDFRCW
ncbi:hypothetical protein [Pseudovibrio sp. Tun.PSC04-5.I4]|uniref:hypothetical protein n=1 Tax=Pseudovibrio sp. Tun.PSC04-5.I4 TaxID=1798213 RepID=UPI000881E169|nr:hypothetical protein [Pseudovibrio sp. Tun.PSC04-5.I4]SDQ14620.1 hypothetical protein SAMN04515695_0165 [Pseudovibrio sp. Tun.PSC04-5.I4]